MCLFFNAQTDIKRVRPMGVRLVRGRMTVSSCEARNTLYQAFMESRTRGDDVVCLPIPMWLCFDSDSLRGF